MWQLSWKLFTDGVLVLDLDNLFWLKIPHMMYILNLSLWSRIIKIKFQAISAIVKLWFTL